MKGEFHGPETGVWKRWLGRYYFTGVFWYKLSLFAVRILPMWLFPFAVFTFTCIFTLALHRVRRAIAGNLALVLGECSWATNWLRAFRTLRNFSWCLGERYEQFLPQCKLETTVVASEAYTELRDQGMPVIFATAHFGGWEIGSVASQNADHPLVVHTVREREIDPESDAFLKDLLNGLGGAQYHIHYADDNPALGVDLLAALREGECVALQADRPATHGKTLDLRLFGQAVQLPAGPAVLARLADVPLVPVFTPRIGRRHYRVIIGDPVRVGRTRDREGDLKSAMQQIIDRMENAIRSEPHQWFCLKSL